MKLLCCEINVSELDQLSYRLGRTCVPVIAPEYRIFQLLRAHYGASRQMRALDFGVVPQEGREERRRKKGQGGGKAVELGPELIDERAFNDIYNQVQGRAGVDLPQADWPSSPPQEPGPEEERLESLPEDAILEELPADAIIGEPVQQRWRPALRPMRKSRSPSSPGTTSPRLRLRRRATRARSISGRR